MNKQQLASKIWEAANKMRSNNIDASEYKDYILGFIFYKFLSEQEETYLKKEGATEQEIQKIVEYSEEAQFVQRNLGYFISYENLFSTWIKKGPDFNIANVRDALSAFNRLINPTHKKVFDGIFNTLETGLSKLGTDSKSQTKAVSELINLIKIIPMDDKQGYDVLGFIYEYLISNFAANAGKKAGEFYTPHEVSILMSEIIADYLKDREEIKIYDPTSGSGSLLINIGQSVAKYINDKNKIKYFAQEVISATYNLTRMNLVMRGILPDNIVARCGDTLADDWPYFDDNDKENTYEALTNIDAVVSNPPYSKGWKPNEKKSDPRFKEYGLAPKTKADYAFLLHGLYHLKAGGIMTIVLPHGVLFRGGDEATIRRNLIEHNNIDAIIGLPANIFFGTGIPTIIMILKKNRTNDDVLIIDASKGFVKEGTKNKLRARDIRKIVDVYENRSNIDKFSRIVSRDEIRNNDYNLNIPRYVDSSEETEKIDVYVTMFGGIPKSEIDEKCHKEFAVFESLERQLFTISDTPYVQMKTDKIKETIKENVEVESFTDSFKRSFDGFEEYLNHLLIDDMDNVAIAKAESIIANEMFKRIENIPLIDKYDAYQILDDRWKSISVDLEMIQTEGRTAITKVDPNMVIKKKNGKNVEVQDGYIGHIIPFAIVQDDFMKDKLAEINAMETELSDIQAKYEELIDEIPEDEKDGLFLNDDNTAFVSKEVGKIAKQYAKGKEPESGSLDSVLVRADSLIKRESSIKKELKKMNNELHLDTKTKIETLSENDQVEMLKHKWISPVVEEISRIPEEVISRLSAKVSILAKKYDETLVDLSEKIETSEKDICSMLDDLVGDEFDIKGLQEFKKLLGGGKND